MRQLTLLLICALATSSVSGADLSIRAVDEIGHAIPNFEAKGNWNWRQLYIYTFTGCRSQAGQNPEGFHDCHRAKRWLCHSGQATPLRPILEGRLRSDNRDGAWDGGRVATSAGPGNQITRRFCSGRVLRWLRKRSREGMAGNNRRVSNFNMLNRESLDGWIRAAASPYGTGPCCWNSRARRVAMLYVPIAWAVGFSKTVCWW